MGRSKRWRTKRLHEKLLAIRIKLGMSQTELIRAMGLEGQIYQANISSYESGEREPPLPIILRYAKLAKVSTDVLIDDGLEVR